MSRVTSPFLVVWMIIGVTSLAIQGWSLASWTLSVEALSTASMVLGGWVFWRDGGPRITAAATYSFAFALFVGFAGLFILRVGQPGQYVPWLLPALAAAYFAQVLTYCIWWYDDREIAGRPEARIVASREVARWGMQVGAVTTSAGVVVIVAGYQGPIAYEVAFVGAVLMSTAMFLRPGPGLGLIRVGVAVALLAVFAKVIYTGFGRLQLGALGLALAFSACSRFRGRVVKAAILLSSPAVMLYLAQQRVQFTGALNAAQKSNVTGFESVISPLSDFANLLGMSHDGQLGWNGFSSFFASAVALVPRSLWSSKPDGLGADLGQLFHPDLQGTGFSELALFHGEWVYAFGALGLVLMVPIVGFALRRLDRALLPIWFAPVQSRRDLARLALLTILISGLPDLFWGGTFLYVTRAGLRAVVLTALLLPAIWTKTTKQASP